jgi:benzoyl-CoA 2,3-dioxygenase component A
MTLFFGARTPDSLPFFGPLKKLPDTLLRKHLVFSREAGAAKEYVQHRMLKERDAIAALLRSEHAHIYICGLKAMETGVEEAFREIATGAGLDWPTLRAALREQGRYHIETY